MLKICGNIDKSQKNGILLVADNCEITRFCIFRNGKFVPMAGQAAEGIYEYLA